MPGAKGTLEERFWAKVAKSEAGCWEWLAEKKGDGYGRIGFGGRAGGQALAHRVSWQINRGPIPEGLILDHICRNRGCVNPDHLRTATFKQNSENVKLNSSSSTGVRGVTWDKKNKKFRAQIGHNRRNVPVGRFDTLEEAAAAAKAKRNELFTYNNEDRI